MKKIISLVLFSSSVGFSHAGTNISEQLAQCQKVTGDSERLQCFDKLGKLKAEDKTESSEPQSTGKWETRSEKSPIDDSSNEFVFLSAESQIRGQFGGAITPFLFITCREKKLSFLSIGRHSWGLMVRVFLLVLMPKKQSIAPGRSPLTIRPPSTADRQSLSSKN